MGRKRKRHLSIIDGPNNHGNTLSFDDDDVEVAAPSQQEMVPKVARPEPAPSKPHHASQDAAPSYSSSKDGPKKQVKPWQLQNKKPKLMPKEELLAFRKNLPIYSARDVLLKEIRSNSSIIVIGETGSGKTTQLAQYIYEELEHGEGGIAITQPRRLAAKTTAARVAEEMGCELGELVGYNVRFDNKTSEKTRIKFLTDGMLLRECMVDKDLKHYSYILIDEAHERSINSDIVCALVKQIQERRKELKIIIMSATLEAELFEQYFKAKVLYVQGRQYPVEVFYTATPQRQYIPALVNTIVQINLHEKTSGDVLAFLTGKEEIEDVAKILEEKSRLFPPECAKLIVAPLYAAQSSEQQSEAFDKTPKGCRKVVLATNIAETSITVPNIKFVVDTGLVKLKQRASRENIDKLESLPIEDTTTAKSTATTNGSSKQPTSTSHTNPATPDSQKRKAKGGHVDMLALASVSKAQAWQRAGRAGRTQPGKAYRLYTESYFLNQMPESQIPEIKRVDLTNLILQLMTIGIEDVAEFPWLEAPNKAMLRHALSALVLHGALDNERKVTKLGRKMAAFPIDPQYAKTLIFSAKYDCTHPVMTIVAMLNTENVFYTPSGASRAAGTVSSSSSKMAIDEDESAFGSASLQARAAADAARKPFTSSFGDHIFLLNVFNAYEREPVSSRKKWANSHYINWRSLDQAIAIRKQLEQYYKDSGAKLRENDAGELLKLVASGDSKEWQNLCERICKAFIHGFFEHVALKRPNGSYETMKESATVSIHPASIMFNAKPECILYNELVFTKNFYVREVLSIQRSWIDECIPNFSANLALPSKDSAAPPASSGTPK